MDRMRRGETTLLWWRSGVLGAGCEDAANGRRSASTVSRTAASNSSTAARAEQIRRLFTFAADQSWRKHMVSLLSLRTGRILMQKVEEKSRRESRTTGRASGSGAKDFDDAVDWSWRAGTTRTAIQVSELFTGGGYGVRL